MDGRLDGGEKRRSDGEEKQQSKVSERRRENKREISGGLEHDWFFAIRGETGCLDTAERDSSLKLTLERTTERKRERMRMRMGRRCGEK